MPKSKLLTRHDIENLPPVPPGERFCDMPLSAEGHAALRRITNGIARLRVNPSGFALSRFARDMQRMADAATQRHQQLLAWCKRHLEARVRVLCPEFDADDEGSWVRLGALLTAHTHLQPSEFQAVRECRTYLYEYIDRVVTILNTEEVQAETMALLRDRLTESPVLAEPVQAIEASPPGRTDDDGSPTDSIEPTHSKDFRSVNWYGETYSFTKTQAIVVSDLWEAWKNGTPDIGDDTLLTEAGSDQGLRELFRTDPGRDSPRHPAWGGMIVEGQSKGTHRLAAPSIKN